MRGKRNACIELVEIAHGIGVRFTCQRQQINKHAAGVIGSYIGLFAVVKRLYVNFYARNITNGSVFARFAFFEIFCPKPNFIGRNSYRCGFAGICFAGFPRKPKRVFFPCNRFKKKRPESRCCCTCSACGKRSARDCFFMIRTHNHNFLMLFSMSAVGKPAHTTT